MLKGFRVILAYTAIFAVLLLLAEVLLSLFYPFPSGFYVSAPNSGFNWKVEPEFIPGIHQDATVKFNSFGSRSDEFENCSEKILCYGGSTTACFALSQENTWTQLLKEKTGACIANFGRLGNSSNHHVQQLRFTLNLKEIEGAKTAVFLTGINDLFGFITRPDRYLGFSDFENQLAAFSYMPNQALPFYRRRALFKLAKAAKNNLGKRNQNKKTYGKELNEGRLLRIQSPKDSILPDLSKGLKKYRSNLEKMIAFCREKNIRPVFMSQPSLYSSNIDPELEKLLLMGMRFENNDFEQPVYFEAAVLEKGLNIFNKELKDVCKKENVAFLDLSVSIPKDTGSFYDDCHFNEAGAIKVADALYLFLDSLENKTLNSDM